MYLIFVAFRNYGDKNTKTFPIIVHFVQKKCEKRAKRRTNRRMSERRAKLAWTIPSEKEEDEIKRAQAMLASALPCSIFCTVLCYFSSVSARFTEKLRIFPL